MPKVKHQPHPPDKPRYEGLTIKQQNFINELVRQVCEESKINADSAVERAYNAEGDSAKAVGSETPI